MISITQALLGGDEHCDQPHGDGHRWPEGALIEAENGFLTYVENLSLRELRELCPNDDSKAMNCLVDLVETFPIPEVIGRLTEFYRAKVGEYYFTLYMEDALRNW